MGAYIPFFRRARAVLGPLDVVRGSGADAEIGGFEGIVAMASEKARWVVTTVIEHCLCERAHI